MSSGSLEARMSHIEGAFDQMNDRLGGIEQRLDSMDHRMEARFAQVDARFSQIDQRFNWVLGTIIGTWITTILAILQHH